MADDILKGKTLKPFLIKTWYQILSLSFYGLCSSSWCKRNKQKKKKKHSQKILQKRDILNIIVTLKVISKFSLSPGNSEDIIQNYNDQIYKAIFLHLKLVIEIRQWFPFRMTSGIKNLGNLYNLKLCWSISGQEVREVACLGYKLGQL